jgi:hypothetical protein
MSLTLKQNTNKRLEAMTQGAEHLPSMCKALGSSSSITKVKNNILGGITTGASNLFLDFFL